MTQFLVRSRIESLKIFRKLEISGFARYAAALVVVVDSFQFQYMVGVLLWRVPMEAKATLIVWAMMS